MPNSQPFPVRGSKKQHLFVYILTYICTTHSRSQSVAACIYTHMYIYTHIYMHNSQPFPVRGSKKQHLLPPIELTKKVVLFVVVTRRHVTFLAYQQQVRGQVACHLFRV